MARKIRIAILDDHQGIIDGYYLRLGKVVGLEIVATASTAEDLEASLADQSVDAVILDVWVPTGPNNPNPYPILNFIPRLLQTYPDLAIIVISAVNERAFIQAVIEAGANGYILKEDQASYETLGTIVSALAKDGGLYLSPMANQKVGSQRKLALTPREMEALSLCNAHPDWPLAKLAKHLGVQPSTIRNTLHGSYIRLEVESRSAAVAKARELGLITPFQPTPGR